MEGLLTPVLFFTGLHFWHMTGEPIMKLDAQFRFQRFGIDSGPDAAEQIEPIRPRAFQTRRGTTEKRFGRDRDPDVRHAPAGEFGSIKSRRSNSNDREEMAVDLVAGTYDGRIRAVLIAPGSIAHDGNRGGALLIVGISHETTDPRLSAEGTKEIARHELAVAGVNGRPGTGAADTKRCVAGLQSGEIGELGRVTAEIFVGLPGEQRKIPVLVLRVAAPIAAAIFIPYAPEFFRPGNRQRLEHYLMNKSKDGGSSADAQSERDDRRGRESWRF